MKHQIRNFPLLKRVLWADFVLGGGTAIIGLCCYRLVSDFLGLPVNVTILIAAVTGLYALVALTLALRNRPPLLPLRILIYANWLWSVISVGLLWCYFYGATLFGAIFLILQVVVVALLAYLEGRHIVSSGSAETAD